MLLSSLSALVTALRDRKGVTAAEYAILGAAVLLAIAGGAAAVGPALTAKFTALTGTLS